MTREDLNAAGQALYGKAWQSPLARDLAVNLRTVQRWASGESPVPGWLGAELATLIRQRIHTLEKLVA